MRALLRKHESKLRFATIGGINTVVDFGLLFLLNGAGVNKYVANLFSTTAAFIFSFFANRSFTFKSKGEIKKQLLPFTVVTLFGLWVLQPIVIWATLIPLSSLDETVALFTAKLIATVVSLVWNYLLYSRFVFKQ